MWIYFIVAVILMIIGHICKALRWKQLISGYEDMENTELLQVLSIGQGMNMLLPYRIGDLARIYFSGKKMKNGYPLSIASVIADLYIETLTVGLAFASLYILGIHSEEISVVTFRYCILSVCLLIVTILAVLLKIYVKKVIQKVASIFNEKIELAILYTTYSGIDSIKNILKKDNLIKVLGQTVLIWTAYFLSYASFALYMQKQGYDFTLTGVFKTIFSMNGMSLLGICIDSGHIVSEATNLLLYMLIPTGVILVYAIIVQTVSVNKAKPVFRYVLPQLNENEKLAFLEVYFQKNERRDYIDLYLNINKDVNVIRDYSAGSNATTMLCMNETGTFFRKYAFEEEALKLQEQVEWLEKYDKILPLSHILRKNIGEKYCYYDMEYNSHTVGFFQYIHSAPANESWDVLYNVLELLKNSIHKIDERIADMEIICKYIDSKVSKNIDICKNGGKYLKELCKFESLLINGMSYPNLNAYHSILCKENLKKVFANDKYAVIHGDLTIENIICIQDKSEDNFYLIDPNTGSLHESPFLDYSKLLQSLHGGYEFLMSVKDVEIIDNKINFLFTKSHAYNNLYENFRKYLLNTFSFNEVRSIYYHELIHYLRLMPYKIKKDPKRAVIFYAGMLMVLRDVKEMFEEE